MNKMAEYFGSSQQSSKDVDYSWILFMHLNRVSEIRPTLFSLERPNAGQLANCWAQTKWTETLLAPFLSKDYYEVQRKKFGVSAKSPYVANIFGNLKQNMIFLEKIDDWNALLNTHAYNNRLLRIRPGSQQNSEFSGGSADAKRKSKDSEVIVEP